MVLTYRAQWAGQQEINPSTPQSKKMGPNNLVCGKGNDYYLIESNQINSALFSKGGVKYGKKS
jgi:hypothetical protein